MTFGIQRRSELPTSASRGPTDRGVGAWCSGSATRSRLTVAAPITSDTNLTEDRTGILLLAFDHGRDSRWPSAGERRAIHRLCWRAHDETNQRRVRNSAVGSPAIRGSHMTTDSSCGLARSAFAYASAFQAVVFRNARFCGLATG